MLTRHKSIIKQESYCKVFTSLGLVTMKEKIRICIYARIDIYVYMQCKNL